MSAFELLVAGGNGSGNNIDDVYESKVCASSAVQHEVAFRRDGWRVVDCRSLQNQDVDRKYSKILSQLG
jgi:hypothetical protein